MDRIAKKKAKAERLARAANTVFPEGVVGLEKTAVANRMRANLLTEQEFAAMLEISMHTAESWRKKHRGPPFVRLGQGVYYRIKDIMAWADGNVQDPDGPQDP